MEFGVINIARVRLVEVDSTNNLGQYYDMRKKEDLAMGLQDFVFVSSESSANSNC